jgi:hypothetical protein
METENPSACATVNWRLCKSEIGLYLSVIKRTRHFRHVYHSTRDNIKMDLREIR